VLKLIDLLLERLHQASGICGGSGRSAARQPFDRIKPLKNAVTQLFQVVK
jgi:hypothetical protein